MTRLGQMIFDDGKNEGKSEGEDIKLIKLVCKKLDKGKSPEEIASDLEEEVPVITCICETARSFAPDYDYDMIYRQLKKEAVQF